MITSKTYDSLIFNFSNAALKRPGNNLTYNVEVIYYETDVPEFRINYSVSVATTGAENNNNYFTINKGNVFINGVAPSSAIDECINYTGKCIFPLEIEIANKLNVNNITEVIERWNTIRPDLKLRYEGAFVDKLVTQMDDMMDDVANISNCILDDIFLQVYFLPFINAEHPYEQCISKFSIIPNSAPVAFLLKRNIEDPGENERALFIINGNCTDTRSFEDVVYSKISPFANERNEESCNGTAEITYTLTEDFGGIESVEGYLSITTGGEQYAGIDISIEKLPDSGQENSDLYN